MRTPFPKLVAVLNVTPDSFSDGGVNDTVERALSHASTLIDDGADVIDVGAESTRPGATPLTSEQEWERLSELWPVLYGLCQENGVLLSLDSYHPETVANALAIGCDWVNDVKGFDNHAMLEAVQDHECRLVMMHSLTVPADKAVTLDTDCDVIDALQHWADQRFELLKKHHISPKRCIVDPGIGFGKTARQSLEIVMRVNEWKRRGAECLVGHSRKSFLSLFDASLEPHEHDPLTLAFSSMLAHHDVQYLRVHDVAAHRQLFDELGDA